MQTEDDLIERDLVYSIVGAFYDVYNDYGYGLLENALLPRSTASFSGGGTVSNEKRNCPCFTKGSALDRIART
jgi:hypothetical protein